MQFTVQSRASGNSRSARYSY